MRDTPRTTRRSIRIVARWDTAHVSAEGCPPLVVTGYPARILGEAVAIGNPVGWESLAASLWPEDAGDRLALHAHLERRRAPCAGTCAP